MHSFFHIAQNAFFSCDRLPSSPNGYFEKEKPRACQGGLIHSNLYLSWKPDQMRAVFKVSSILSTIFNRQFFSLIFPDDSIVLPTIIVGTLVIVFGLPFFSVANISLYSKITDEKTQGK